MFEWEIYDPTKIRQLERGTASAMGGTLDIEQKVYFGYISGI